MKPGAWTKEEDAAVLAGATTLPGRSPQSCRSRLRRIRDPEGVKLANKRYDEKRLAAAKADRERAAAERPRPPENPKAEPKKRGFTPDEDALVLAGRRDLPGRSAKSCRMRALMLRDWDRIRAESAARWQRVKAGLPPKPRRPKAPKPVKPPRAPRVQKPPKPARQPRWTPEMEQQLLAGRREFPGIKEGAVRTKIERMRDVKGFAIWWRHEGPAYRMWTPEEEAAVTAGALRLPTRTRSQIHGKRKHLGISKTRAPLWNAEQDKQLLCDPRADLPGRTHRAKLSRLHKLGAVMPRLDALSIRRQQLTKRWQRQEREAARAAPGGILSTASPRADGFDLLSEILRAVPGRLPPHIREEAIAEAALLCLERQISPADAATEALSRARRFIDVDKKHVELNERYHQIPQWSAA